jgi:hypothetical protein
MQPDPPTMDEVAARNLAVIRAARHREQEEAGRTAAEAARAEARARAERHRVAALQAASAASTPDDDASLRAWLHRDRAARGRRRQDDD